MFVRSPRHILTLGLLLSALSAAPASAQDAKPDDEVPRSQRIHAVERGFFVEADVGVGGLIGEVEDRKYSLGTQFAVAMGYDVLPVFQLSLGLSAFAVGQKSAWGEPRPIYDLVYMGPVLRAQLALLTTERNFFWVRGEGGFAFGRPSAFVDDGLMFGGALGYEHFAMLRHFSWGIAAGVSVFTKPSTVIAVTVTPMVKYTF